jgi:hypothetical protein
MTPLSGGREGPNGGRSLPAERLGTYLEKNKQKNGHKNIRNRNESSFLLSGSASRSRQKHIQE